MKYQRLRTNGAEDSSILFIPASSRSPSNPFSTTTKSPVRFVIFCVIFVSLYFLIYSPLSTWSSNPGVIPNMTWVLRQRESFMGIIQPANLSALITPTDAVCDPLRILTVVVCSAVPNRKSREAIRHSWAKDSPKESRVFFLVGKSVSNDTSIQENIEAEAEKYNDIIQEDFQDTYFNLTLKSVFMLKWASQSRCAETSRFILKTDDDMYINLPNLVSLLRSKGRKGLLLGSLFKKSEPIHDIKSKWYVPPYVFSEKYYPNYLSGTGYVLSTDILPKLLKATEKVPFFHLEDIYVTGMLARNAGIQRLNHDGFKYYKRRNNVCLFRKLISAHQMTPKEMETMYLAVHDRTKTCR